VRTHAHAALALVVVLVGCGATSDVEAIVHDVGSDDGIDVGIDVGIHAHVDLPFEESETERRRDVHTLSPSRAPFVPEGGGPIAIGPREARASSAACGTCHREEHAAWSRSAHARSHVDPLYVRELAVRPSVSCERCHAPLAEDVTTRTEGAWADEGVGCAACHVREGVVVHTRASGRAPHETRIEPRVGEVEACRSCHQFHFEVPSTIGPDLRAPIVTFDPRDWLQDTVGEWSESDEARAGLGCSDCHVPERAGAHDHGLPGLRDVALASRALDVEVDVHAEQASDLVTVRLRSRAGHAVPTGDLYRTLELRAWREGEPASTRSERLGRVYARRGARRVEIEDDRVMPGRDRVVTLRLPRLDHADRPVSWAIRVWSLHPDLARREHLEDAVHELTRGRVVRR
jgi:hypothetical protein